MTTVLKVNNLSKSYGSLWAVNKLSFEVKKGSVYGILGPNGSGKTTTLGMLVSAINPSHGSFEWFGKQASANTRKGIGIFLEKPNFYDYLSAENNLKIVADIRELDYSLVESALKTVSLWERRDSKFKTFSLGMKQRLAIASAIMGDPEMLVLDEPTNGLDPEGIAEVRDLILRLADEGKTIILASHLLDEVQKVCTNLLVLKSGVKIYDGSIDDISQTNDQIEISAEDNQALLDALQSYPDIVDCKLEGNIIIGKLHNNSKSSTLNTFLHQKGIALKHLQVRKASLEAQVLNLLKN
ncbi:MAG: ABC transporter ATP-binding protein [Bacteroidales bacterium]|nr:ABC transporter ATP-binding protein [Bacteroidales bacterium]